MPGVLSWGWDPTNKVWVPIKVSPAGSVCTTETVDYLDDIGDVEVPTPTDGYVLYWDAATSLWKCKAPPAGTHYGLIKGATYNRRYTAAITTSALGMAGVGAVANALRVLPFIPPMDIVADRICCNCTTLYAGGKIRLGIYADNGSLYPGSLLVDSGDITCDAAGFKDVIINQALSQGTLYWIGYVVNGITTLAFSRIAPGCTPAVTGVSAANPPAVGMGWTVAHDYGALPNPYTDGGAVFAQIIEILVAIRAK